MASELGFSKELVIEMGERLVGVNRQHLNGIMESSG